jgi:hypothetical protein
MHFLPIKFAYPSRATRFMKLTLVFTTGLLLIMPTIVWFHPVTPVWLKGTAIICLIFFGGLAVVDTFGVGSSRQNS